MQRGSVKSTMWLGLLERDRPFMSQPAPTTSYGRPMRWRQATSSASMGFRTSLHRTMQPLFTGPTKGNCHDCSVVGEARKQLQPALVTNEAGCRNERSTISERPFQGELEYAGTDSEECGCDQTRAPNRGIGGIVRKPPSNVRVRCGEILRVGHVESLRAEL